jgi:bacterioferritin
MQPEPGIVELLNEMLTAELTAVNQYFVHAKMCENWGFARLATAIRDESIDEMKHADALIERILFFGGVPNLQRLGALRVGETVREQFTNDLALEVEARARFNRGIEACVAAGDNGTRALLDGMLTSEEDHADWLETQLEAMDLVGEQRYLAAQLH